MKIHSAIFLLDQLLIPSIDSAVPYHGKVDVSHLCPRNKFIIKHKNGTMKCNKCSRCHKGSRVKTECAMFTDTVCEPCPDGTYSYGTGNKCMPCTACSPGEFIRRNCTVKRDTKCRKCPRGYFTLSGNVISCVRCKQCRKNEIIITKCDGKRDTECGNCYYDHFRVSSSGSCLQCSECPHRLNGVVVPECRDKLGMHNSHICWPRDIREFAPDMTTSGIKKVLADTHKEISDRRNRYENMVSGLFVALFVIIVFFTSFVIYKNREHCLQCRKVDSSCSDKVWCSDDDVESTDDSLQNNDNVFIDTDSDKTSGIYDSYDKHSFKEYNYLNDSLTHDEKSTRAKNLDQRTCG